MASIAKSVDLIVCYGRVAKDSPRRQKRRQNVAKVSVWRHRPLKDRLANWLILKG
jgi:hypothetical protein